MNIDKHDLYLSTIIILKSQITQFRTELHVWASTQKQGPAGEVAA